jgi:hypothetical protein
MINQPLNSGAIFAPARAYQQLDFGPPGEITQPGVWMVRVQHTAPERGKDYDLFNPHGTVIRSGASSEPLLAVSVAPNPRSQHAGAANGKNLRGICLACS